MSNVNILFKSSHLLQSGLQEKVISLLPSYNSSIQKVLRQNGCSTKRCLIHIKAVFLVIFLFLFLFYSTKMVKDPSMKRFFIQSERQTLSPAPLFLLVEACGRKQCLLCAEKAELIDILQRN